MRDLQRAGDLLARAAALHSEARKLEREAYQYWPEFDPDFKMRAAKTFGAATKSGTRE